MIPLGGDSWLGFAAISAGFGTLVLVRHLLAHRGKPGANWFVAGLSTQAVFCLAHGFGLFVHWRPLRVAMEGVAWLGLVWTGPLFLVFALSYTGRATPSTGWFRVAFGAVMTITTVAVVTAPAHDLVWWGVALESTDGLATLTYGFGPLGYAVVVFGTALASVGALVLVDTVVSYGPLYRREAAAVTLSTLPPGVAIVAWLAGILPTLGPTVVAIAFVPHVLLDAYAFVGSNMFETNPTTRRAADETAIDDIATPVLVLDPGDRVVDFNAAARPLLAAGSESDSVAPDALSRGADGGRGGGDDGGRGGNGGDGGGVDPLGTPVDQLVDIGPELLADGGPADPVERPITEQVGGRRREYVVSRSPLTDPAGTRVGTTLVFTDVTRERRHEQRLAVLNRVLRHNLRNAMTVVVGNARLLQADAESESVVDVAAAIDRSATDLLDVGEKAREFEALRGDGPRYRAVSVAETVERAAAAGRPADATGRLDVSAADAEIRTDPKRCSLIVENLVENAFEHVAAPSVVVTATAGDDAVVVTVSDDGPGIPEGELAPMESGTETSLEHGGGIGLWIVQWCVTSLGGHWSVNTDDGTTVTVRLPDGRNKTV